MNKKCSQESSEIRIRPRVAVDAIFDSVSLTTTFKEELQAHGVIYCSFGEAVENHPNSFKNTWVLWFRHPTTSTRR